MTTITLYHGTTEENAEQINNDGFIRAPAYFTPKKENAGDYGEVIFELDIDVDLLNIDNESYDGIDVEEAIYDGASFYVNEDVKI
jgi:hypothetical protein